ncbi:tetraspanin-8 [Elaeis guineensis]|uniref:Tetraspanin-8 n=1 Tax=Elaeis guineensis var. tenera TaxID=51953 RepID=A0A6J0PL27_ELAGV|nr:tetraspanin-8 [Elaeis guineensis]
MVKFSNSLLGLLNFVTFFISFLIIGIGLWFKLISSAECGKFLQLPILSFGIFLMVVSLFGMVGSCCYVSLLLWIYLFVMFMFILGMLGFTMFTFMVTNKGIGQAIGTSYKEYSLEGHSNWLRKKMGEYHTWKDIQTCLNDAKVCGGFQTEMGLKADEFYKQYLSPLQSGCCKPPTYCGYTYENATYWTVPKSGLKSEETDCKMWSNDQQTLCYNCNSCKAGVLQTIKDKWKQSAIFNFALLVFLNIVYSVGCCALQNNRNRKKYRSIYYYTGPYAYRQVEWA